ncbi:MAG: class I adenylate-forming enzyme family protein [Hydrogenophaga sp.]
MSHSRPWPDTALPLPATTFSALLERLVAQAPLAPALSWHDPAVPDSGWQSLDRDTLAVRVRGCAAALALHGVQAGDRVAWLGLNHPGTLVLLFALARLRAVLVPLNHRLAAAEWQAVLADCKPCLLVHDVPLAEAARALGEAATLPALDWSGLERSNAADAPAAHDTPQAPLLLVYTSGTTGRPKAAVHTQANLLANMAMAAAVQGITAADRVLTVLPLFHVGGLCIQTLPALSVGAHVHLFTRFDAGATLRSIARDRHTLTLQVPATLQALTQHADWRHTDLSRLRAVWAGSSLLPPAPLQAFMARGVPVCNVYGSTETGPFSIALPPAHAADHLGSCGWPAPGVQVRLLDEQGAEVPAGQVGEVAVRGPNVADRYWPDQPVLDADGFFRSGDLAQQAADGSFTVVGRAKDMIISGGENIYPAEIEHLIAQHPLVAECSVVGQPDARWGEAAVAVVVLHGPAAGDEWVTPLQAWLDGRLARYKWPRRWVRVDALPRTALGKVQKAALKALLQAPQG